MLKDETEIGLEVVKAFEEQFKEERNSVVLSMLEFIPLLIDLEKNEQIATLPTEGEVKKAVFQLSGSSVVGPYGFTLPFFQVC